MTDTPTPAPEPEVEAVDDEGRNREGEAVAGFNPADVPEVEAPAAAPVDVVQGDEVVTFEGGEETGRRPFAPDDVEVDADVQVERGEGVDVEAEAEATND